MSTPLSFDEEAETAETDPCTLYLQGIRDSVSEDFWSEFTAVFETDAERQEWLQEPQILLDGRTPEQVLETDDEESVLAILSEMDYWF